MKIDIALKAEAAGRQLRSVNVELEVPLNLNAIYQAYAGRVAGWAARLSGPALDAEDIVHEVFLTVHKELPRFRGEAKLTTWLYGITANVVRDRRRKERRRWLRHLLSHREQQALAPRVRTPAEAAESRQATALVYKVLDGMRENYRTVLILFELEGLSGEEIADLTQVNLSTVWVWLHRARALFRKRLTQQYPAEFPATRLLSQASMIALTQVGARPEAPPQLAAHAWTPLRWGWLPASTAAVAIGTVVALVGPARLRPQPHITARHSETESSRRPLPAPLFQAGSPALPSPGDETAPPQPHTAPATAAGTAKTGPGPGPGHDRRVAPPPQLPPAEDKPADPLRTETQLLSDAMTRLRTARDAPGALAVLDAYHVQFPQGQLQPEAALLRINVLLALGRKEEALAALDSQPLAAGTPRTLELRVTRGELLASLDRCADAVAEFDAVLEQVEGALQERALYGRSRCRTQLGDSGGARNDLATYLRRFPQGRFSASARQNFLSGHQPASLL